MEYHFFSSTPPWQPAALLLNVIKFALDAIIWKFLCFRAKQRWWWKIGRRRKKFAASSQSGCNQLAPVVDISSLIQLSAVERKWGRRVVRKEKKRLDKTVPQKDFKRFSVRKLYQCVIISRLFLDNSSQFHMYLHYTSFRAWLVSLSAVSSSPLCRLTS